MKKLLFSATLFISGCCLFFLIVQPNRNGLMVLAAGVLCSALGGILLKSKREKDYSLKKKRNILSLFTSVVIVGFIGLFNGGLPKKYGSSAMVSSVFERIGLEKDLGLTVIAVVVSLLALPGLYAFFVILSDDDEKEDHSAVNSFFPSDAFFYCCFAIGVLLCGVLTITSFSYDITIDDAFSLRLIESDFTHLTELTANDFHPPLYYYLLKIFVSVLSFTRINVVFLGKIFSVVPYIILLFFCFFRYKKTKRNDFAYGFSILFYACFWCTYSQTMQIRMYTWGLLFVTFVFLEAKNLIENDKTANWTRISVFALLCCYTQYFAGVAAVVIYGFLGLYYLIKKRKKIWKLLVSGIAVAVGYLPWLFVLYRQFSQVEGDSNTLYIVSNTFSGYLKYFITSELAPDRKWFPELFFILFLLLVFPRFIRFCHSRPLSQSAWVLMGVLSALSVALLGDIMSIIGNPIFLPRYLFMSLLCAVIPVGFVLGNEGKLIKAFMCCWACAMLTVQMVSFCGGQATAAGEAKKWRDTLLAENNSKVYVEELGFDGRIIKQLTGLDVENFVEETCSADYKKNMERVNPSLVDRMDKVFYGDDYNVHFCRNGDLLINAAQENGSISVVLFQNEIATQLEKTGMVHSEYLCDCIHGSQLFRLTFIE